MIDRSVTHSTFVIERTYDAPIARVWNAWADPEAKARWFAGPPGDWTQGPRHLDFRIGGTESDIGTHKDGFVSTYNSTYFDIVEHARIINSYEMLINGDRDPRTPLPGLFAAGVDAGGVYGRTYGGFLGWSLVSGRQAGCSAAAYVGNR